MHRIALLLVLLSLGLTRPADEPAVRVLRPGDEFDVEQIVAFIEAGGDVIAVRDAAMRLPAEVTGVAFSGEAYSDGEPVVMRSSRLLAKVTQTMLGREMSEGFVPWPTSFDEERIATLLSIDMDATPRKAKVHVPTLWIATHGDGRVMVSLGRYTEDSERRLLEDAVAFLQTGDVLEPNPAWHRRETAAAMKAMSDERSDANQFEENE